MSPSRSTLPAAAWRRVLVLAAHPDDESLAAGGLIQTARDRGAELRVIFVTDGDNNPWPQRFLERRWQINETARARWGVRRRAEARSAWQVLAGRAEEIVFWGFPDQGLTGLLRTAPQGLSARLTAEIGQWQPTLLIAPSVHDHHPDHSALGVFVHFVLTAAPAERSSSLTRLDYVVHPRNSVAAGQPWTLHLSQAQVARKREAIFCHQTQVALSRWRFQKYARAEEVFFLPPPLAEFEPGHPVRSGKYEGGVLRLMLRPSLRPATVLLAADTPLQRLRLAIKLSSETETTVRDDASGEDQGRVQRMPGPDGDELRISAPLFPGVDTLAVKVCSSSTLYDHSGWRLLPLRSRAPVPEKIASLGRAPGAICALIPCYNIASVCGSVVRAAAGFANHVIAINDGSTDHTSAVLHEVARDCDGKVTVLDFPVNRGKGFVLLDGFRQALQLDGLEVVVTLDGDGQHRAEDIPRLARTLRDGDCALVIGERLAQARMPLRSMIGNLLTSRLIRALHPAAPIDTQSGFRAFQRDFAREIVVSVEGGRYETELRILLLALRQSRRLGSVVIPTVYIDGNRLSHFRPLADSWRIYRTLLSRPATAPLPGRTKPSWPGA